MHEIKCPNCGTVFQIDESDYQNVLKQVRDKEFESEIKRRENEYQKEKEAAKRAAQKHQARKPSAILEEIEGMFGVVDSDMQF